MTETAEWSSQVARRAHNAKAEGSNPSSAKPKYRRIAELIIRPLVLRKEKCAFDIAREFYSHYSDLSFEDDYLDYVRTGFTITRPHLFAMVKMIDLAPQPEGEVDREKSHRGATEPAWFIRCIVGDLTEAISCLPCMLPRIVFCRNNDPSKLVICDTERLIRVAFATMKKNNSNGKEK